MPSSEHDMEAHVRRLEKQYRVFVKWLEAVSHGGMTDAKKLKGFNSALDAVVRRHDFSADEMTSVLLAYCDTSEPAAREAIENFRIRAIAVRDFLEARGETKAEAQSTSAGSPGQAELGALRLS